MSPIILCINIIKYSWTDSSLNQTLYQSDGQLFSKESMVRPNKREYILRKSKVSKIKNYYNDILVDSIISNQNWMSIMKHSLSEPASDFTNSLFYKYLYYTGN